MRYEIKTIEFSRKCSQSWSFSKGYLTVPSVRERITAKGEEDTLECWMEKLCACDDLNWLATWQNLQLSKNGAFGHAWKACGWCHFMCCGLRRNKMKRGSQKLPSWSVLLIDCGAAKWPAVSSSCFLDFPSMMDYIHLNSELKIIPVPIVSFTRVFYRNKRRSNWNHTMFSISSKIYNHKCLLQLGT